MLVCWPENSSAAQQKKERVISRFCLPGQPAVCLPPNPKNGSRREPSAGDPFAFVPPGLARAVPSFCVTDFSVISTALSIPTPRPRPLFFGDHLVPGLSFVQSQSGRSFFSSIVLFFETFWLGDSRPGEEPPAGFSRERIFFCQRERAGGYKVPAPGAAGGERGERRRHR